MPRSVIFTGDVLGHHDMVDESKVPVGDSMVYMYDFGDNWRHALVLEKIAPMEAATA